MPYRPAGILVVDDYEPIRRLISHTLAEIGYVVRSAEDGLSALLEIHREMPDILLSGHHGEIEKWRREQARLRTHQRRPDIL